MNGNGRLGGAVCLAVLLAMLRAGPAQAQGAGANVNFLTPEGVQLLSVSYLESNSNFRFGQTAFDEFSVETNTGNFGWSWRFGLLDRLAVVGAGLNYIDISAVARVDLGDESRTLAARRRGLGDPRVVFRLGLVGTPSLPPEEWRSYDKGFQLSIETGLRMPLGDYDPRFVLNPGYNRTAVDLSLPTVIPLDGARRATFIELTPQVVWFGDNTDAPLSATRLAQDPLYLAEAHASHHLGGRWWFSMGVQYQHGGGTTLDGIPRDNTVDQWFAEAGVGMALGRHATLSLGYGRIFAAGNDARGEAWRVRLGILP